MSFDDQKDQNPKDWVISEKYGGSQVVFNRQSRSQSILSGTSKKSIAMAQKLYGRRWMMLVLYYWSMFANSIPYEVVQPISVSVGLIYEIDSQIVTLALTLYMAMHPIFSFYCAQVIVQRGWAFSTNVGILLTILGCGIRLLVNKWGFFVILIGQTLCGIGRPFIMNSQASIASNWFYPQSRTFIIAGLNILHTFSMVVSIAIPGSLIFKNYKIEPSTQQEKQEEGRQLFYKVQWVEFLIVLTLLPCLLLLRNQPPSMPTKNHKIEEKAPFLETLRLLGKNKKFLCILIPYSIYFGLFKSLINILSYILTPFGFTSGQISIAGELPLVFALVSTGMIPIVINRYKRHKLIVNFLLFCSSGLLVCILLAAKTGVAYIVYIVTALTGFFLMPIVPVMFELACDSIFPLGASFAVGGMYIGSTLMSVIGNQLLTLIIGGKGSTPGSVTWTIGISLVSFVFGALVFQWAKIRQYSKVKIESVESVQSLLKQRTESTLFENASLFQCSMNIGLVGDTPIIDLNVNRDDLSEDSDQPPDQFNYQQK